MIRGYTVKQIIPEFTQGRDHMINKCMEEILELDGEIAAFFVDLSIDDQITDKEGIMIGEMLRKDYPDTPMFCVTHKSRHDNNFDYMSDATLEDFDGVFEKNYLVGSDFSKQRFDAMLRKAGIKRARAKAAEAATAATGRTSKPASSGCDVAILTALFEYEYEQALNYLKVDNRRSKAAGTESTKIGKLKGTKLSAVVDYQQRMGMVDAAILSATILGKFHPKLLIMTGVCAGRHSKGVELGHIIVPKEIYDYQSGKLDKGVYLPYPYRVAVDYNLISMARAWKKELLREMEDRAETQKGRIKGTAVHFDIMACGSLVLKTDGSLDNIAEKLDEKTVAVEMESYGIARSCDLEPYKSTTKAIIIKASMDGAGADKNDTDKEWAAYISTSFAYSFVKKLEREGYFA